MTSSGQEADRERLASIRDEYGVAELEIFGAGAQGEARPSSDLDLLYVLTPDATRGWRVEQLDDELDRLFRRHVGLVSKRALNARIRESVLAESRPVHVAA